MYDPQSDTLPLNMSLPMLALGLVYLGALLTNIVIFAWLVFKVRSTDLGGSGEHAVRICIFDRHGQIQNHSTLWSYSRTSQSDQGIQKDDLVEAH